MTTDEDKFFLEIMQLVQEDNVSIQDVHNNFDIVMSKLIQKYRDLPKSSHSEYIIAMLKHNYPEEFV